MALFAFILNLFSQPHQFAPSDRVNLVRHGLVLRLDGVVVTQSKAGVLVEWPDGGTSMADPSMLVRQVPDTHFACA